MRVIGVEIKGGEAVFCLLGMEDGLFAVPSMRQLSMPMPKLESTEAIRKFHFAFGKLMEDYHVDQIVIIDRPQKGKFAGSGGSFKMEAAMQLVGVNAAVVHPTEVKEWIKRNPVQASFDELGLKKFQKAAFDAAYAYCQRETYTEDDA
ncbi:DUF3010 family protein [Ferrimonas lipolytica]|uniref:DUF3010 family protein n=1 Tax=Ferrimonas lipolytica TaxID=2724191 RepID=A0A6H1UE20_9GAMM|nr:DUF3010 family protein [Ferrimonas lipolytica]QIZ77331.1 DUF3010 family protein [Ferrimonas lipolytica]